MNCKDNIFSDCEKAPNPFEFNETVAVCFDDMVKRSVPLYNESIRLQCEFASKYYIEGTNIFDLGCSNGNFGISFLELMKDKNFSIYAADNSYAMIEIYKKRLNSRNNNNRIKLINSDVADMDFPNASVIVMNLTMQFIKPEKRDALVKKIYNSLVPGGIFLLTEKVCTENVKYSEISQDIYYDFKKKNGYSQLEINKKREALDNVLIPETKENHIQRLNSVGFKFTDIYLKWLQFTSFIAGK